MRCNEFSSKTRGIFGLQKNFRNCLCVFPTLKSAPEASLDTFSTFKRTFIAFPERFQPSKVLSMLVHACFHASKVLLLVSLRNFCFQKNFRSCLCVFPPLKSTPEASLGAFSGFGSVPADSLVQFHALGAFLRLRQRVFGFRENSRSHTRRNFDFWERSQVEVVSFPQNLLDIFFAFCYNACIETNFVDAVWA